MELVTRTLRILIIYGNGSVHIGTVADHLRAFLHFGRNEYSLFDSAALGELDLDLTWYDVVVVHYSVILSHTSYINAALKQRISDFPGLKVAFVQDEYRWIDRQNLAIRDLGVSVIFTVTNPQVTRQIYRADWFDKVRFEHTLTGFTPEHLRSIDVPPYCARAFDVTYRARKAPPWYGKFADQKWLIAERFLADSAKYGLNVDIDTTEERRIYGDAWIKFLANSKATLGTESGVSFIDFSGTVGDEVDAFVAQNPAAPRDLIQSRFLEGRDGEISIQVISPRIFEAAALRTLMILYPGEYSGVLIPWRHYVPLEFDHSNMAEVVSIIRDEARAESIIRAAFDEVAMSSRWTFAAMVEHFEGVCGEELRTRRRTDSSGDVLVNPIVDALNLRFAPISQRTAYLEKHVMPVYEALVGDYRTLASAHNELASAHNELASAHNELATQHKKVALISRLLMRVERIVKAIGQAIGLRRNKTK